MIVLNSCMYSRYVFDVTLNTFFSSQKKELTNDVYCDIMIAVLLMIYKQAPRCQSGNYLVSSIRLKWLNGPSNWCGY